MARRIQGIKLKPPKLRFDYSFATQVASNPYNGLVNYGPYDKHIRRFSKIRILVITPEDRKNDMKSFVNLLQVGSHPYLGFYRLFRLPLECSEIVAFARGNPSSIAEETRIYERKIKEILEDRRLDSFDLIIVGVPKTPEENIETPYYRSKAILAAAGLPSQMVTWDLFESKYRLRMALTDLATGIYAKVGGRPWALAISGELGVECILGIGLALRSVSRIGEKARYVGFVNLFEQNGNFLLTRGIPSVAEFENYMDHISNEIASMIEAFNRLKGRLPQRVIIHTYKTSGKRERAAIRSALSEVYGSINNVEYAIVRITDAPALRLFDFDHKSYATEEGICVPLSSKTAVFTTTGRRDGKLPKLGTPVPLYISIEEKSKNSNFRVDSIAEQVYHLTRIDWRSVTIVKRKPVTIKYSSILAKLISAMWTEEWNETVSRTKLVNKAWFI